MSAQVAPERSVFQKWFDLLSTKDSSLYYELKSRFDERVARPEVMESPVGVTFESMRRESDADIRSMVLETIVREGRPAIPILENRVSFKGAIVDAAAETIVNRLKQAVPTVEPCIPLVGRIDVDNHPSSLTYLGTGWLVGPNVAVTNRHVAELIARSDNGKFRFRPGRLGEDLRVTLDYRHELGINATDAVPVARVIWIERDSRGPDIAFLELDQRTDGTRKQFIPLAESDAQTDSEVVVIGYPARAPAHIIPDQAWMDQIYGGAYDVKRIAPGLVGANSRGWATHDCTTLGGNSGSVVVDMTTGQAVALHFAGLYMIENYAVPASTIRKYLKERPWQGESVTKPVAPAAGTSRAGSLQPTSTLPAKRVLPGDATTASKIETRIDRAQVSFTIPLTVTVSLGAPQTTIATGEASLTTSSGVAGAGIAARDIHEAARSPPRASGRRRVLSLARLQN